MQHRAPVMGANAAVGSDRSSHCSVTMPPQAGQALLPLLCGAQPVAARSRRTSEPSEPQLCGSVPDSSSSCW